MARKTETEATDTRWAVLYRVGSQGRRAHTDVWLVIEDVPAELGSADVLESLQAWHRWPSWQTRIGVNGRVTVQAERSWPAAVRQVIDPPGGHTEAVVAAMHQSGVRLSWAELAPTTRRFTTPVDSLTYAAVQRAAARVGQSLVQWVGEAIADKLLRQDAESAFDAGVAAVAAHQDGVPHVVGS